MIIKENLANRLEEGILCILLSYYIGPNVPNVVVQAWALLGFLAVPLLILRRWRRFIYVATRDPLILSLIGFAIFSALWSTSFTVTLAYSRALLVSTAFGIYLATRYSLEEQVYFIFRILCVFTLLNFLAPLLFPSYGINFGYVGGAVWNGIQRHKNELSGAMSLATSLFLIIAIYSSKYRFTAVMGSILGFSLLLLSQGKGSLGIFLGSLLLLPLYKIIRQEYRLRVVILITFLSALGVIIISALININFIVVDLLGKDLNFNARGPLWSLLISLGSEKPWLGFGYGGFWIDSANAKSVAAGFPWITGVGDGGGNAHNGYIELFLQLGWVGLSAMIIHLLLIFSRTIFLLGLTKRLEYLWLLSLILIMSITNFYESYCSFLTYRHWFWVLYVSGSYSSLVELREIFRKKHIRI